MTKEGLSFLTSIVKEQSLEKNEGVILELGPLFGSSTDAISKGRSSENPSKIISIENVDGLLVGGASLKKSDFMVICNC